MNDIEREGSLHRVEFDERNILAPYVLVYHGGALLGRLVRLKLKTRPRPYHGWEGSVWQLQEDGTEQEIQGTFTPDFSHVPAKS